MNYIPQLCTFLWKALFEDVAMLHSGPLGSGNQASSLKAIQQQHIKHVTLILLTIEFKKH